MPPKATPAFTSNEAIAKAERNYEIAKAMSRNDMLRLGFLKVADLDDEEVRAGRGREQSGAIDTKKAATEPLPNDIYQQILQEHQRRMNDRLRSEMDRSLDVMVEIRDDRTAEPGDRFKAAQYIFERVAGKTPETVKVAVAKAPWEEVFDGIAAMPSPANRPEIVDGQVIEAVPYGHIQTPSEETSSGQDYKPAPPDTAPPDTQDPTIQPTEGEEDGSTRTGPSEAMVRGMVPMGRPSGADPSHPADPAPAGSPVEPGQHQSATRSEDPFSARPSAEDDSEERPTVPPETYGHPGYPPAYSAPDHFHPVNTMSTAPRGYIPPQDQEQYAMPSEPLSQKLRDQRQAAQELAAARKEARDLRKGAKDARAEASPERAAAKKRRIVYRAMGMDAMDDFDISAEVQSAPNGDGEITWKLNG